MLHEVAPCTCGLLYGSCGGGCGGAAASAFSLLFPAAGDLYRQCGVEEGGNGSVDCTLSLGTPSTRRAEAGAQGPRLAWPDMVVSGRGGASGKQQEAGGACREPSGGCGGGLVARRCANCDTTSTPLWRNGPRGPKSLCNACGIRYKKEERRAAAAVAAPAASDSGIGYAYGYSRQQQQPQWGCYGPAAPKTASFAMFGDVDAADDGPCLSWRLNVMTPSPAFAVREPASLFQYY